MTLAAAGCHRTVPIPILQSQRTIESAEAQIAEGVALSPDEAIWIAGRAETPAIWRIAKNSDSATPLTPPLAGRSPLRIAPAVNGDLFIAMTTSGNNGPGDTDAALARIDPAGQIVWTKELSRDHPDQLFGIVACADGGCTVAGNGNSLGGSRPGVWVKHFAADGAISWERAYVAHRDQSGLLLIPAHAGEYLLVGRAYHPVKSKYDLWLKWITPKGKPGRELDAELRQGANILAATADQDNGVVLSGFVPVPDVGGMRRRGWVMAVTDTGTIAWEWIDSGPRTSRLDAICRTDQGTICAVGRASSDDRSWNALLLAFDGGGNITNQQLFDERPSQFSALAYQTPWLVAAGSQAPTGSHGGHIWICKFTLAPPK